jgi:hypothetical protein
VNNTAIKVVVCKTIFEVEAVDWMSSGSILQDQAAASPLVVRIYSYYMRFEVIAAMTMKNTVFWDVIRVANVASSSPILVTLMMEVLLSSETLILTTATRRNNTEDDILYIHIVYLSYADG